MEDQCIEKRSAGEKLLLFYGRASHALHCAIKLSPENSAVESAQAVSTAHLRTGEPRHLADA